MSGLLMGSLIKVITDVDSLSIEDKEVKILTSIIDLAVRIHYSHHQTFKAYTTLPYKEEHEQAGTSQTHKGTNPKNIYITIALP